MTENRARHRGLADVAGHRTDRLDVGGQVGRHEDALAGVELDPRPGLGEQLVVRLRAAGHDDEVALDPVAVDRDLGDVALAALRLDRARLALAEVDHAGHLDPRRLEVGRRLQPPVVDRQHDGALGGLDRPVVDEAAHTVGEHHADEVVAREDERLLDDPARHDDAPRAELQEQVAVRDGDETLLEEADRDRRGEQLDARVDRALPQPRRGADAVPVGEQRAADVGALVDDNHRLAAGGSVDRGLEPGLAAAEDGHVDVPVLDLDALRALASWVERAEPRRATEELLVQRATTCEAG